MGALIRSAAQIRSDVAAYDRAMLPKPTPDPRPVLRLVTPRRTRYCHVKGCEVHLTQVREFNRLLHAGVSPWAAVVLSEELSAAALPVWGEEL